MHPLLFSLIGLPVAIGFFYLYKDLRKVKRWDIERDRLAPTATEQGLESVGYLEPVTDAKVEAGVESAGAGLGHLVESAGHFLHH